MRGGWQVAWGRRARYWLWTSRPLSLASLAAQPRASTRRRIEFLQADIQRLPLEANSLDFAWCAQSLYSSARSDCCASGTWLKP